MCNIVIFQPHTQDYRKPPSVKHMCREHIFAVLQVVCRFHLVHLVQVNWLKQVPIYGLQRNCQSVIYFTPW